MSADDAILAFHGAQVVGVTPKVSPEWSPALLQQLTGLRAVALHATGYDMVDTEVLEAFDVDLAVLPDYSTVAVAEHTLALIFALACRVHLANDRSRGLVPADTSLRGFELAGRTLGVIGLGRIGHRVARLGRGIGMRVIGSDRHDRTSEDVERVALDEAAPPQRRHLPELFHAARSGPHAGGT